MKKPNVFISWSGTRSKLIAVAFYDWLPMVVQAVRPWMSTANIDKGSRGLMEMAKALDGIKVGITCLTPENLDAPWILYEAGSLAKTVDDSTRLCTYLLGDLKNADIEPPLGQFQLAVLLTREAGVTHEQLHERFAYYERGEEVSIPLTLSEEAIRNLGFGPITAA